ncbi:hypothetical protein BYT27DRAFT_7241992 [Phlegmacium glaucopus]|nr:hypothetical protein BYT27DRAFT_7241992 [Phlegmacium glaucopus]
MPDPIAHIRSYEAKDKKLVQFMIGKANFATLAVANQRVYTNPVTLAIWIALSSVFVQYMKWWPIPSLGWLGYLKPLPAFASMAVPIMFFVDWINRPYFENQTQEVLRSSDLHDIPAYYSNKPGSGFWLLEYGDRFVGLIAVDATNNESDDSSVSEIKGKTATIRHFFVDEAFRATNIQEDLLQHAVKHAFKDPKVQRIEAFDSPLVPYLRTCLRNTGFQLDHNTKKIGLLGWSLGVRYLNRDGWKEDLAGNISSDTLKIHDWLDHVPGYRDASSMPSDLLEIVEKALQVTSGPVNVIIDSLDTLLSDKESSSETYLCLSSLYALVKNRPGTRLILHSQSPSNILPLITQTAFSSSLLHIIVHPPVLLNYIATEFLMPPPPLTPLPKFWSLFLPISERVHDTEQLVFGADGEGSGHQTEFVVEVVAREGSGRNRGVERALEGWSTIQGGPCELTSLESLSHLLKKQKVHIDAPDPTQNLSFNLSLTSSQQQSRAQVPLPYVHEGQPTAKQTPSTAPIAIFYDPDSADDIDDDDPDEDLDI